MRICFSAQHTGLANNGGTRTIVRCAETLAALGHAVFIWVRHGCYTWHKPVGVRFVISQPAKLDAMIATGWGSYKSVLGSNVPVRAVYARGLEFWNASESQLIDRLRQFPRIFVNSAWQVEYLRGWDLAATLQYPGLDWDWFFNCCGPRGGVGALMHPSKTKRSADCEAVECKLNASPWRYLNRHIKRPDSLTLNVWYNKLKVWFAPTELEGLHNPPTEAALAGCALVCTDHARSGMWDYAEHGVTALMYPARYLRAAEECVRCLLEDEPLRVRLNLALVERLRSVMGTREERMREFAERLAS